MNDSLKLRDVRTTFVHMAFLVFGSFIAAVAVILFFEPYEIAPSGVSGLAVIINTLTGTPIGLVILVANIPIQFIGYKMLGGWRVVFRTGLVLVIYSFGIDILTPYFPTGGITDDRLLSALFGGILGGIGGGLVYRAGGTFGGTSTLARILQKRIGSSLNNIYLYTDTAVVLLAGLVYGWEGALYAMVAIFVDGAVADYILEGPSTIRMATIITNKPDEVATGVMNRMGRGVTSWQGKGMYTGESRTVLFVTVMRPEINELRELIFAIDRDAFFVIGQGHTAFGEGFRTTTKAPQ